MTAIHRALRERTAHAHARLDDLFGDFQLDDRLGYTAFLCAHLEAVLPIEAALDASGAERIVPDWPERRRGHALIRDLDDLDPGRPAPAAASHGADDWDDATIAGAIYVLEGSRLGGRFLERLVPPHFPRRYLADEQPAAMWRGLFDRIGPLLADAARLDDAVASALAVFESFEQSGCKWLARV